MVLICEIEHIATYKISDRIHFDFEVSPNFDDVNLLLSWQLIHQISMSLNPIFGKLPAI
jgi:hypothetical protein